MTQFDLVAADSCQSHSCCCYYLVLDEATNSRNPTPAGVVYLSMSTLSGECIIPRLSEMLKYKTWPRSDSDYLLA